MFSPVLALANEFVFQALPRYGGWFSAALDNIPAMNSVISSVGEFAFHTLPRYGGWGAWLF